MLRSSLNIDDIESLELEITAVVQEKGAATS